MKYREGFKYQLSDDEITVLSFKPDKSIITEYIHLTETGILRVKAGYAWDGASGPTLDTKSAMRGSLIHDSLYQLLREGHLPQSMRKTIDNEFGLILERDGMWWWRRKLWVRELKKFGESAADPKNKKKVLVAP